jgi:hypothetical protein
MSSTPTPSSEGIKVRLTVCHFNPLVNDKQAAAEQAKKKDANARQHSHQVHLVDGDDIKTLKVVESEGRAAFQRLVSAPWLDYKPDPNEKVNLSTKGCWYFLSTEYLSEYLDTMSKYRQRFEVAKQDFLRRYPDLLLKAATSRGLGHDFIRFRHRFPTQDAVGERVSFTTFEDPIVTSFMPDVFDERLRVEIEKLDERKKEQVEYGLQAVTLDVTKEVIKSAAHVGKQCEAKNKSSSSPITGSVVERLVENLEMADRKSPRPSADLDEAILIGKGLLEDLDADILKANEHSRNKVIAGTNRMKDLIQL